MSLSIHEPGCGKKRRSTGPWRSRLGRILVCLALGLTWGVPIGAETIRIPVKVQSLEFEQPSDYFTTLLLMALEASKADNEAIDLIFSPREYTQARWVNMLQHDKSNFVIWTMTSKERETQLRPIRIPLFKGLFGYRVLLIRKDEQERFDGITTVGDLARLLGGQGVYWPDTQILQTNGLRVTTAETTDTLYRMINAKRFDYFPRGVSEVWFELLQRNEQDLKVEDNLLLYYPTAIYFFVNKENEALAQRIEKGLEILIDKGEFDRFFYQHPRVKHGLSQLGHRRLLTLGNPFLPSNLPVGHPRYWITIPPLTLEGKGAAGRSKP